MKIRFIQKEINNGQDCLKIESYSNSAKYRNNTTIYDSHYCLDQILFYNDLLNWEQIKELTIPEYYYRQLEMFNFALPSDEPTSQP